MLAEIGAGLGSLKAAMDLAKGLSAANTQATLNDIKIELQSRILEAQEALASAREASTSDAQRIRDLEQAIVQFKDWEAEKQRYRLTAVDPGAFAYTHKPGMEDGEPPHWLCAGCFEKRQRSFLQTRGHVMPDGRRLDKARWGCNSCKGEILVYYTRKPGVEAKGSDGA